MVILKRQKLVKNSDAIIRKSMAEMLKMVFLVMLKKH